MKGNLLFAALMAGTLVTPIMPVLAMDEMEEVAGSSVTIGDEFWDSFPDQSLQNYMKSNGITNMELVKSTPTLNLNNRRIENLKGIELFTSLTKLDISGSSGLDYLDLSKVKTLRELNCRNAGLVDLDLPRDLEILDCQDNNLRTLDLTGLSNLTSVKCQNQNKGNGLLTLTIPSPQKLTVLDCSNNKLKGLDISNASNLMNLNCSKNSLSSLTLPSTNSLATIDCSSNSLEELDLRGETGLTDLNCSNNKLQKLEVPQDHNYNTFNCSNNQLVALDLGTSHFTKSLNFSGQQRPCLNKGGKVKVSELGIKNPNGTMKDFVGAEKGEAMEYLSLTSGSSSISYNYLTGATDTNNNPIKMPVTLVKKDTSTPSAPSAPVEDHDGTPMHRLYNPNSGEHFYTASDNEAKELVKLGWKSEGIGWYASDSKGQPVYRLYNQNAGDHHYTLDLNEKDTLVKLGWKYEGIGWYSENSKGEAVYRQYNPNATGAGSHNYTTNKAENDNLVNNGWKYEGVAWYGVK